MRVRERELSEHYRVGDIVVGGIAATIGHLRAAAFLAGFPASVPVKKVDRLCSSGLQAVADAALGISGGLYECAIAAGVESMSTGYVRPHSRQCGSALRVS
jgi:acetyl-CoA acyltransferase 1